MINLIYIYKSLVIIITIVQSASISCMKLDLVMGVWWLCYPFRRDYQLKTVIFTAIPVIYRIYLLYVGVCTIICTIIRISTISTISTYIIINDAITDIIIVLCLHPTEIQIQQQPSNKSRINSILNIIDNSLTFIILCFNLSP